MSSEKGKTTNVFFVCLFFFDAHKACQGDLQKNRDKRIKKIYIGGIKSLRPPKTAKVPLVVLKPQFETIQTRTHPHTTPVERDFRA